VWESWAGKQPGPSLCKYLLFRGQDIGSQLLKQVEEDAAKRHCSRLMLNTAHEEDERPSLPDPVRDAAHAETILYFECDRVDGIHPILIFMKVFEAKEGQGRYLREMLGVHWGWWETCVSITFIVKF
jgi:ribosomal protein S18 acetylase RimI-like enzyme